MKKHFTHCCLLLTLLASRPLLAQRTWTDPGSGTRVTTQGLTFKDVYLGSPHQSRLSGQEVILGMPLCLFIEGIGGLGKGQSALAAFVQVKDAKGAVLERQELPLPDSLNQPAGRELLSFMLPISGSKFIPGVSYQYQLRVYDKKNPAHDLIAEITLRFRPDVRPPIPRSFFNTQTHIRITQTGLLVQSIFLQDIRKTRLDDNQVIPGATYSIAFSGVGGFVEGKKIFPGLLIWLDGERGEDVIESTPRGLDPEINEFWSDFTINKNLKTGQKIRLKALFWDKKSLRETLAEVELVVK